MFHRSLDNNTNSIHERALRITYEDHASIFQTLLNKENYFSIDCTNLQVLATEMFKTPRGLSKRTISVFRHNFVKFLQKPHFQKKPNAFFFDRTDASSLLASRTLCVLPQTLPLMHISYSFLK